MKHDLARQIFVGLKALIALTLVLGVAYPAAVWGVGQVSWHDNAHGQIVSAGGTDVGSKVIGQNFPVKDDGLFHGRPSAADYDTMASGLSNLGPSNPDLLATIAERQEAVAAVEDVQVADIPVDAVTASGSGLDPYVSPQYAMLQVARVAEMRGTTPDAVRSMVADATTGRQLGFLGQPRVNVLKLNLALQGN